MSAPKNPPKPPPDTPPAPTPSQQQAMGANAMHGVDPSTQTPDQAREQVRQNVQDDPTLKAMGLSDEERAKIAQESAAATIAALEARGAFEPPPAPTPAAPETEGLQQQEQNPTPPAPRKRSFAERFIGRE